MKSIGFKNLMSRKLMPLQDGLWPNNRIEYADRILYEI